ncbi:MAG: CocE/NonD family hydrolase [Gemmatimonadaceae bacterium]
MTRLRSLTHAACLALVCAATASAQQSDSAFIRAEYTKHEYRIAMRDGVQLFTIVYVPKDASPAHPYPMVMQRTCYSVAPYGPDQYPAHLGPDPFMMHDKYIFVYQDVRGRYMSEGTFVNVRPFIPDSIKARDHTKTDEASDTYDTIDWLLKNVPDNNGRVGQWGISYPGFYTTMGALSGHPALVAASPQAPVTNFYFEDFHHNGALTQAYFYTYPLFGIQHPAPTPDAWWQPSMVKDGLPDDYDFQLGLGPLSTTTNRYYKNNFFWQEIIQHPDYDAFWKARAVAPHLNGHMPAMLTVGGWFDAEDLYGPLTVYKTIQAHHPTNYNAIVEGPFRHGGWSRTGIVHTVHGDIYFGDSLETKFQRDVEAKFFHHFLKDDGKGPVGLPNALIFDTGDKVWRSFDSWPVKSAIHRELYFEPDGRLSFTAPPGGSAFDEYVSDPAQPVPSRCRIPTIQGLTMYQYMSDDQRCFDDRRDVVTYETDSLPQDVTLGGEMTARLFVSTSGTDADYVVKLIDVYPMGEADSPYRPDTTVHYAGYQQLVRGEIMRGRYRDGFDRPAPFVPGRVTQVQFRLQDVLHTFKTGHRIMIQVQSSWFPAFDRNPQHYVPNIYDAKATDFVKATERIFHEPGHASGLEVEVLPGGR